MLSVPNMLQPIEGDQSSSTSLPSVMGLPVRLYAAYKKHKDIKTFEECFVVEVLRSS